MKFSMGQHVVSAREGLVADGALKGLLSSVFSLVPLHIFHPRESSFTLRALEPKFLSSLLVWPSGSWRDDAFHHASEEKRKNEEK